MSKKEFDESKNGIKLNEINVGNITVSNRIKGNNDTVKYFTGYMDDTNVIPLFLILTQMSGWIKYFENGGKNMSFKIEDESVYVKHNSIWNKIKDSLSGIKLHSEPVSDNQYIKTKTFSEVIKTLFDGDKQPEERIEYTCLACISVDSVLKVDRKNYPQVYLEQCKYKFKKRELKSFIDYEIDLDSSNYESD